MRKHGWQLPHHPLQVVAVTVFLALGFAFYVFFAPFVGKKMYQYIVMGIYTPLIACAFGLYIWCAASDPADPGVFRSKKYLKVPQDGKQSKEVKDGKQGEGSASSMHNGSVGGKSQDTATFRTNSSLKDPNRSIENENSSSQRSLSLRFLYFPCALISHCCGARQDSSERQMSEDGMFYCSLCEVEVFKHSKHCRVCDKCVDRFDHHCRWLNNCIGKKNYRQFFILMVSAILLIALQWATGIFVLIRCFLERKHFSTYISAKLGSSFSLVPFVIVVALCTVLAMIATLPLAQLFFFHILLIKKGISTYDYIVALREQEQEQEGGGGQQSPQMSTVSSITGLSSASSFSTFHRGGTAWCTPPRLFLEDQFDVVPPENASVSSYGKSSYGKKTVGEEPVKKKNVPVKISPWALARLNAEDVSRAAAEARKKSKILQPVTRRELTPFGLEAGTSFGRRSLPRPETESNDKRRAGKRERIRIPAGLSQEPLTSVMAKGPPRGFPETSSSLAPLQLEARSAFQPGRGMSSLGGVVAVASSSPDSSLGSPEIHPFRLSSSGAEDSRQSTGLVPSHLPTQTGIPLSRSNSDGYEASGGEDSDRVPSRSVHRSTHWSNLHFDADAAKMKIQPSSRQ